MAEVNGQAEWKIEINVAGVAPLRPGTYVRVDDGAYPGKILSAVQVANKKDASKANVMFTIQHLETNIGAEGTSYKGQEHRVYVPIRPLLTNAQIAALPDKERKAYTFNQAQWRTILESIGAQPERLDANPVCSVSSELFTGLRACYFVVINPPEGELNADGTKKYADVSFCNAAHYKKMRDAAAASSADVSPMGMGAVPQLQLQTQQPPALGALGSLLGTVPAATAQSAAGNGIPALRL
jgi:hypothetical protein